MTNQLLILLLNLLMLASVVAGIIWIVTRRW